MGRPLIIKIYHKISDNINVDLKDLSNCLALPSQAIMDNIFYYGEAIILGNLPLEDKDYDMLISVSESISFRMYADDLKECIKEKSNSPYWEREIEHRVYDLRNPCLIEQKRKIFKTFGLDADKTYEENLKIMEEE